MDNYTPDQTTAKQDTEGRSLTRNQNAIPAIIADIMTMTKAGQPFESAFMTASPALGCLLEKNAMPGDSTVTREKI